MDLAQIKDHWTDWARHYGQDLKATTKTSTIKALELAALERAIKKVLPEGKAGRVLEAGCGNGMNVLALAQAFPALSFDGMDYIPDMIGNARALLAERGNPDRIRFFTGDVTKLGDTPEVRPHYDIVFTDRMLINLNTPDLQKEGIRALASRVGPGGALIMLENSTRTHGLQNDCREALGLPRRKAADFNLFYDEDDVLPFTESLGFTIETEDFGSLHDILLYALVPAINGGTVDYDHPVIEAATRLCLQKPELSTGFGQCGQNRVYLCRRTKS